MFLSIIKSVIIDKIELLFLFTCRVGEINNAGGRLQQVGAAGRQVARDGHDGHAVTTLLGTNNAVVLRVTHPTITREESREGRETWEKKEKEVRERWEGRTVLKEKGKGCGIMRERIRERKQEHLIFSIKYKVNVAKFILGCYFAAVDIFHKSG